MKMHIEKMKPRHKNVLVKSKVPEKRSRVGAMAENMVGTVVAVGPEAGDDLKPGVRVHIMSAGLLRPSMGDDILPAGIEGDDDYHYQMVEDEHILAILPQSEM